MSQSLKDPKTKGAVKGRLDVKRFYLPGLKISGRCPYCGKIHAFDMSKRYLDDPTIGAGFDVLYGLCQHCEGEISVRVSIDFSVNVVGDDE